MKRPGRVAVVGVGILGACVGWNLARYGADVVFVDAGRPGEGVTDWSFSWVNASNKTVRRSYFDLNVAGMAAYRELAGVVGAGSWWHPGGHLRWTDDPAAEARLLEAVELLAGWDYRVEALTGAEVRRRLEPALTMPDEAPVVFYPDEAWVHGRRLVGCLVDQAAASGAEQRFGVAVRDLVPGGDGGIWTVVLSDGSRLDVDVVVNAAGPRAADVAALVGRHLPMRPEPGVITRIACAQVPVRRVMHAPHIELRPDGDASMVLHSREIDALINAPEGPGERPREGSRGGTREGRRGEAGEDPRGAMREGAHGSAGEGPLGGVRGEAGGGVGPDELARRLHELAWHVVPELGGARIVRTRVVERPIPGDGFPSVGAVPNVPGYYEAVSHSGITLGPVIGRLLATEIVTGRRDEMLAEFRPERFPS